MKKLFVMLAALLAIALPQAARAIDVEGVYVGGLAGLNWLTNTKSNHHETFKAGWIGGLNLGYRTCGGLRGEGEISFRSNKHKHAHRPVQAWSFMANGYYEISQCWCITPYIGAGIGYDTIKHKKCHSTILVLDDAGVPVEIESGSHNDHEHGFSWQVMAGAFYDIDECMEMGLEYRFHKGPLKKLYNNAVDLRVNWFF